MSAVLSNHVTWHIEFTAELDECALNLLFKYGMNEEARRG
jgi:hypothetical protein